MVFTPQIVRFDATWKCNLNCRHCQNGIFRNENHPIDLKTNQIINLFNQLSDLGTTNIGFLGGEPLLRDDIVFLLNHLNKLGIKSMVTTNGLLLNDYSIKSIINANTSISISLDGPSKESHEYIRGKDTYYKVINAITKSREASLSNKNVRIGISATINKRNINEVEKYLVLAKNLGVDYLLLSVVHKNGNAQNNWKNLEVNTKQQIYIGEKIAERMVTDKKLPEISVNFFSPAYIEYLNRVKGLSIKHEDRINRAAISECYIQCDGHVYPSQQCSQMIPKSLEGAQYLGMQFNHNSVLDYSFFNIWNSLDFKKYRSIYYKREYIKNYYPCSDCIFSKTYCMPSLGFSLIGEKYPQPICTEIHRILGNELKIKKNNPIDLSTPDMVLKSR